MGLIREPRDIDFSIRSEPWTEVELADFRKIMQKLKVKKSKGRRIFRNNKETSSP